MSPKQAGQFPVVTFLDPGALRPWVLMLMALGCGGARSGAVTPSPSPQADARTTPDEPGLVVEMRRTGCEGICPIYRLTVHGDGRVVYDGDLHVKVRGRRESRLTSAQLARLRRTLAEHVKPEVLYGEREREGYRCPHGGIDLAGVVLLAPEAGVSEPICYVNSVLMGASPSLGGVDYLIEEIVGSQRWAGCSDDWKGYGGC